MDFIFDPNLGLHFPLHEVNGSPFISWDARGQPGTVTGALWTPQGRYFDGIDDYINGGDNSALRPTSGHTLEVWVKPLAKDGYIVHMPYTTTWTSPYYGFGIFYNVNQLFMIAWNVGGAGNSIQGTPGDAPQDTWYHAVYTFNGTNHILYLNGAVYKQITNAGSINFNGSPRLSLGTRNVDSLGEYGKGTIGEVRLYNRPFTRLEVQRNYLATKWRYR